MPRILVVDDDALARAVVADAVRNHGMTVVAVSGGAAALELLATNTFDLLISDVRMPEIDGFELVRRLRARGSGMPVVLMSAVRDAEVLAEAARRGVSFQGFVAKPIGAEPLARMLERWGAEPLPIADAGDAWSGEEFLARMDGPEERFPVFRALYLASRVEASGALVVEGDGDPQVVALRNGRVQYAQGIPGLVPSLPAANERRDLVADVGAAVAAGQSPDQVLTRAGEAIGAWAVGRIGRKGGRVWWDRAFRVPTGAFVLPQPLTRMLGVAHARHREARAIEALWSSRTFARVGVRVPDDSVEARWGLDPTALRLLRAAQGAPEVGAVLRLAIGTEAVRRAESLRALDLLYLWGFLWVGEVAVAPTEVAEVVAVDPALLAGLREALRLMEGQRPSEVLQIADKPPLTPNAVSAAYRDISKRYHPDQFFGAAPEVRTLAEACFARVNAAYETLRNSAALEEENRVLDARKKGVPYVSEADKMAARVSFRRGELHLRNRDWAEAAEHLGRAAQLDPVTWPHELMAAQAAWLARRATPAETLARLDRINADRPDRRAEVLVVMGNVHKLDQRLPEAAAKYREALDKHPENRDALRELRLYERRGGPPAPAAPAPAPAGGPAKAEPGRPAAPAPGGAGGFFAGLIARAQEATKKPAEAPKKKEGGG